MTGEVRWCVPHPVGLAYDRVAEHAVTEHDGAAELRRAHNTWKRTLLDRLVRPGHTVLDLACGRGGDLHKFRHAGATLYHGVDVARGNLEEARRRAARVAPPMRCIFHVADLGLERLPLRDASVDVASCQFALHYLADDPARMRTFLGEVARVLRPGGRFVASVPCQVTIRDICAGRRPAPSSHMCIAAPPRRDLPDDDVLHEYPWGHPYVFEFRGRTPANLTEYLVYPPALEDLDVPLTLDRRSEGPAPYLALEFVRENTLP